MLVKTSTNKVHIHLWPVFSVTPFKIDQNQNQNRPIDRPESGKWKEVNMQRPSPRFRSEEYFVYEISEKMFSEN